jgi:hypothetical protein
MAAPSTVEQLGAHETDPAPFRRVLFGDVNALDRETRDGRCTLRTLTYVHGHSDIPQGVKQHLQRRQA